MSDVKTQRGIKIARFAIYLPLILLLAYFAWQKWFVPKNAKAFNGVALVKAEIKDVKEDVVTLTAEGCDLDKANQAQITNLKDVPLVLTLSRVSKDNGTVYATWDITLQPLEVTTIRLPRADDGKIEENVEVRLKKEDAKK